MRTLTTTLAFVVLVFGLSGCKPSPQTGHTVAASGKQSTSIDGVPAEVLAVAKAAQPELEVSEVEYETRDGNEYYDVGGTLPDGSELELDMTMIDGQWTVVETQRDIEMGTVPETVADALLSAKPAWTTRRIIESDQGDGVIVYEFFGSDGDQEEVKVEVKLEAGQAELLVDEWIH
ncbi:MAG: hypothetical protein AAFO81_01130 [Pseudomonadota bacterium]